MKELDAFCRIIYRIERTLFTNVTSWNQFLQTVEQGGQVADHGEFDTLEELVENAASLSDW
ncbi:MAG: hypothetical protein J6N51_01420 [Selenomonas sp.]|nr:hypothetical protein [Selenomonas sp.]